MTKPDNSVFLEHDEYMLCGDCIHRTKQSPSPCDSCEQETPTNFEEGLKTGKGFVCDVETYKDVR